MRSHQHEVPSYQETTTSLLLTIPGDNLQVGHVGAGVWLALCALDDLPWNTEAQGLNTEGAPAGFKLEQASLESALALRSASSSRVALVSAVFAPGTAAKLALDASQSRSPKVFPHSHSALTQPSSVPMHDQLSRFLSLPSPYPRLLRDQPSYKARR